MDRTEEYRELIIEELQRFVDFTPVNKAEENQTVSHLIVDPVRLHFLVMAIGWPDNKRIYFPIFHLRIHNDKVWVEHTSSDYDIVGILEERGIPAKDIVLAFHAPSMRKYTDYASA